MLLRLLLPLVFIGTRTHAGELPSLPISSRVLTEAEVKNYWVNTIRKRPVPPKPTRLHMDALGKWQADLNERVTMVESIRGGACDLEARLACLAHNTDAWELQGEPEKARKTEQRLLRLREHLAKMAALEARRRAAEQAIADAARIRALESEISQLRQEISRTGDCN